jgi:hypothetical protein
MGADDLIKLHHVLRIATCTVSVFRRPHEVEVSKEDPEFIMLHDNVFKPVNKINSALPRARSIDVREFERMLGFSGLEGYGESKNFIMNNQAREERTTPDNDKTTRCTTRGNKFKFIKTSWGKFANERVVKMAFF